MKNSKVHIGNLSPEMTLLGLLYRGPSHGYDLHRTVVADLGEIWHLSQSQAYSILRRLEARGDISVEETTQEKYPPRQLLQLTSTGRERFLTWLESPTLGGMRNIRMEFLTRLYFLGLYFPEKIGAAFEQQKSETRKQIERLQVRRAAVDLNQIYNLMSIDLRLKQLNIVQEWLDDCQRYFIQNFGQGA